MTLIGIVAVILAIGFAFGVVGAYNVDKPGIKGALVYIGIGIICIGFIIGIIALCKHDASLPKEFPATKYSLELKVIEFQGQKDTIYILTPKEK
jgi:hypothetical protein